MIKKDNNSRQSNYKCSNIKLVQFLYDAFGAVN